MQHHLPAPRDPTEVKLIEERILQLAGNVLQPAEWLNLMAAAETVLPRKGGRRMKASDLNLPALGSRPQVRLLAAVLGAVGAQATYKISRRYRISDWAAIAWRFADLSLYVIPPARLEYAVELCQLAINGKDAKESISLVNALSELDGRVVRQLVSSQKMGEWSTVICENLKQRCMEGEDIDSKNDSEEPYDPDDYDEWLSVSQRILSIGDGFYGWAQVGQSGDLARLKALIDRVERPPDPEMPEVEDLEHVTPSRSSSYWTLERMFEDL